ncbi:YicC family protein [Pseudorhodobacter turbinis]|uniref:YicC family protein n=1 Tax=Pseudorhodobacter turbinis TaxID=2500533 RepID=A0A4V1E0J3_9RHOB|nr:YicC/YloC family endoribonuclease [Pseudorhodobacter turbinis]QCO54834.1 YicC family protein [Pseudorhodobacter turbinis]
MTKSMTGYATRRGQFAAYSWQLDVRSVNAKGLDLRLRVPEWVNGLEGEMRAILSKNLTRGSISVTLKVAREAAGESALRLNTPALRSALSMLSEVEAAAMASGMTLAQASQADVLLMRGVMEQNQTEEDTTPLAAAILQDFQAAVEDLKFMRAQEGAALHIIIQNQLAQIEAHTTTAEAEAENRSQTAAETLRDNVQKLLQATDSIDQVRLAQELALLAVKTDIREELDRLHAHTDAAHALIAADVSVGRKLDFLMQEFMREANTLCSKAQSLALTRVGLDLKTVIDQMREQVQNVE